MEEIDYYTFESFNRCRCREKIGEVYQVECKAQQRGEKTYAYRKGTEHLEYGWKGKRFALSREALGTVLKEVKAFDAHLEAALETYAKIDLSEFGLTLYYRRISDELFNILWESETQDGKRYRFKEAIPLSDVIREIQFTELGRGADFRDRVERLFCSTKDTIDENPLYISAIETGDMILQDRLLIYYRIADKEACKRISDITGSRILPSLPKEYDKTYSVEARTIDYDLLERSGYLIQHRPYFAMQGSTHAAYELNPHAKGGVDAAKVDLPMITFEEYLKLFDR